MFFINKSNIVRYSYFFCLVTTSNWNPGMTPESPLDEEWLERGSK